MYDHDWILISNGSFRGYFDWIPSHLRTGPWSTMAIWYFRTLWCVVVVVVVVFGTIIHYDDNDHHNSTVYSTNDAVGTSRMIHDDDWTTTTSVCSVSTNGVMAQQPPQQRDCDSFTAPMSLSSSNINNNNNNFNYFLHWFVRRYWTDPTATAILQMPPVQITSVSFYYNASIGLYMMYICYSIVAHSPLSYGAWITYTVQSWTLLTVRHLLYALSGMFDHGTTTPNNNDHHHHQNYHTNTFVVLAELIRFPCAVAHTTTFVVWNFLLVPYILGVALAKEPSSRRDDFVRFCTSFRLLNLHGMNIIFCAANVWYWNNDHHGHGTTTTTRSRPLEMADLYASLISMLGYFTFYLCVLDRLGIHLYPIFSPRHSNIIVFVVWTSVILLYIATFHVWQFIIQM